ncbi:putative methionine-R-sulfoxide reductase [Candidatus Nitrososphaera gargensis Ga9.2]|uniref:Putative methionine-R-sulfoxide reductase n=1 Tax=Nitrososphaera gargensis (strain Ga9.2) TaxID=1237085 RepID=K0ICD7_NITGG|nr:putative methionine-R-sulfoxide reductase [Candidatus Nitrososphaera gargensis Ga9.2]
MLEQGHRPPFSGEYNNCKDKGIYKCVYCGISLFSSDEVRLGYRLA